eukprot:CAMPEP_0171232352 /NCGR_PEP_ID=MMETSP0790-20130122/40366_1 /TAXON_ID=2925 /ORGANISM="Alexandrium catenella, Strain OF101" /LENGTH=249 /DNA_ID=CAMNT_0011698589 /DNA_START=197 /DNA_END=943 /DNA_ORIENTATION=+
MSCALAEHRHEVLGLHALRADGEVQWQEVARRGVRHVDGDAAQEHQVPGAVVGVDDGEHLLLHDLVELLHQGNHRVRRAVDLGDEGPQFVSNEALLRVAGVRAEPRARRQLAVGGVEGPAGRGGGGLAPPLELARCAVGGVAEVGAEDHDNMPVVRHVVREGEEAGLPDVGHAAKAAEREHGAVVLGQQRGEVALVVVDLVRADGGAVDDVPPRESVGLQCGESLGHHGGTLHDTGEMADHRGVHAGPL